MWMMGCDGGELTMSDSFSGQKFRPLILNSATPFLAGVHGTDRVALNQHLVTAAEQSKSSTHQQVVVSSRWNPTPEQLETLEELYRRGTRTPSAEQIQQITAELRRYGKIEGKNVFYWFQNHKARERQKRRRQLESVSDEQCRDIETTERKESGSELEQTKSLANPTNCSTLVEKNGSIIQRAEKAAASAPECTADGWIQFDEGGLQQRRSLLDRNATWQKMQSSSSPPVSAHLINTNAAITAVFTTTTPSVTETAIIMEPKSLIKSSQDHLSTFVPGLPAPAGEGLDAAGSSYDRAAKPSCGESQTLLQLFPLRDDGCENVAGSREEVESAGVANFAPHRFFEFLPLKN